LATIICAVAMALPLRVPISLDELKKRSALDLFGAEKHTRKIRGAKRSKQLQKFGVRHYKTPFSSNYQ
jgi:hypothetical protein